MFDKKLNGQYIELPSCETFSIADEPVIIWALGFSGWLEIRPSEKFQRMYSKMVEAVSIYFFIRDLHEKQRHKKKAKTLSLEKVLLKVGSHI